MTTYRFTVLIESGMSEEVVRKQLERQLAGYPCVVKRFHTSSINASYTRSVDVLQGEVDRLKKQLAEAKA